MTGIEPLTRNHALSLAYDNQLTSCLAGLFAKNATLSELLFQSVISTAYNLPSTLVTTLETLYRYYLSSICQFLLEKQTWRKFIRRSTNNTADCLAHFICFRSKFDTYYLNYSYFLSNIMPKLRKQRKFYGNRWTKNSIQPESTESSSTPSTSAIASPTASNTNVPLPATSTAGRTEAAQTPTASSSKLSTSMSAVELDTDSTSGKEKHPDCFLVQSNIVLELLSQLASGKLFCSTHPDAQMSISIAPVSGIVCSIDFHCSTCKVLLQRYVMSERDGSKRYALNTRLAFGATVAGGHRALAATVSAYLGMPPPVACNQWAVDIERFRRVTEEHANKSMCRAAREASVNGTDITVSCDGTWQRRGFSSKNGIATVITHNGTDVTIPGKVVDVEVLTSHCHTCAVAANKKVDPNSSG